MPFMYPHVLLLFWRRMRSNLGVGIYVGSGAAATMPMSLGSPVSFGGIQLGESSAHLSAFPSTNSSKMARTAHDKSGFMASVAD